jgi:hypothetical protein
MTGGIYGLAKLLGVKEYVAIEPYYAKSLSNSLYKNKKSREAEKDIPISIVQKDALSFLKLAEESSANIFTCATDSAILPDTEYNRKLENEIARIIGEKHAFLGIDTTLSPSEHIPEQEVKTIPSEANKQFGREKPYEYKMRLWAKEF